MMNGFGNMFGFGWAGMIVGTILLLVVLALLAWAAFSVAARGSNTGRETPLDILKRRYAAGEISSAEFEQAKEGLA